MSKPPGAIPSSTRRHPPPVKHHRGTLREAYEARRHHLHSRSSHPRHRRWARFVGFQVRADATLLTVRPPKTWPSGFIGSLMGGSVDIFVTTPTARRICRPGFHRWLRHPSPVLSDGHYACRSNGSSLLQFFFFNCVLRLSNNPP